MTDIAEKLRDYANDDHERLCQGRTYSCSCGYDDKRDPLMTEAAETITALRAENEKLRAALEKIVKPGGADSIWECVEIARAALKGETNGN